MPRVSVLMPIYNAAPYLREAIGSVLNQSFGDYEFIIVDDASTDGSAAILDTYLDPRIVRITNANNQGVSKSLNLALNRARGDLVARMDADDISLPGRFEEQVKYLTKNTFVGVLGTPVVYIGSEKYRGEISKQPLHHNEAVWALLFGNPFIHPSIMARRHLLMEAGGYCLDGPAQDRDLWIRVFRKTQFDNLATPLLKYRLHDASVTSLRRKARRGLATSPYVEPDCMLRKRLFEDILRRVIPAEVIGWLTASQGTQSALTSGLDDQQIAAVIALLLEAYHALKEQEIFVGDVSSVKQDLMRRIIAASRYSPQCVMPGQLTRVWKRPVLRRVLMAIKHSLRFFKIWPPGWH